VFARTRPALLLLLLLSGAISAEYVAGAEDARARQNYILNCQGCHLADGSGFPGKIPNMRGFVGNFLRVQGGREFIVQVPGVANAPLSDAELAAVVNWLLLSFSREQLPEDYQPYTAAEVASLRRSTLLDIGPVREGLIRKMGEDSGQR